MTHHLFLLLGIFFYYLGIRVIFIFSFKAYLMEETKTIPLTILFIIITKTCLYNFDPLQPHFYIVKLAFTGVYISLYISAQKHRLWVFIRTVSLRQF